MKYRKCAQNPQNSVLSGSVKPFADIADGRSSAEDLYSELRTREVILSVSRSGALEFDAPKNAITDSLRGRIQVHLAELLSLVERIEERAAIIEHEGRVTRAEAERMSRMELIDDAPEEMPQGVYCPSCQGRRLIDDPEGLRCWDCRGLAWVWISGAIVRADCLKIGLDT